MAEKIKNEMRKEKIYKRSKRDTSSLFGGYLTAMYLIILFFWFTILRQWVN